MSALSLGHLLLTFFVIPISELHQSHHGRLQAALIAFNEALYSVLKSSSDPTGFFSPQTTPISAHSNVKEAIQNLQSEAARNQKKVSFDYV